MGHRLSAAGLAIAKGVVSREATYAPGTRIARHEHRWAFIAFVARGTVEEECGRETSIRGAGGVRIMPADLPHANAYRADGARCFVTELHAEGAECLSRVGVLAVPSVHAPGSPVSRLAARMHAEYRLGDELSPLAIDGLLRELAVAAARGARDDGRARGPMPAWLRRVHERMHDEFPRVPTLRALADEAGVHPAHLVRTFRRHFHRAPAEYMGHLRIEHARGALAGSRRPIAQIALEAGFADQAHFTRRFRAITGTTPARYRAENTSLG